MRLGYDFQLISESRDFGLEFFSLTKRLASLLSKLRINRPLRTHLIGEVPAIGRACSPERDGVSFKLCNRVFCRAGQRTRIDFQTTPKSGLAYSNRINQLRPYLHLRTALTIRHGGRPVHGSLVGLWGSRLSHARRQQDRKPAQDCALISVHVLLV